ncbi:tetratricopeptide repeat protein [Melghirimyces profundicolus]|uniref:Tetratricopeptide repeat protein n=1 Tax=Melghirimyces profundicolus TaxID=1242148 RepID=A0A2T6BCH8_9BACL|nr:tetratricopeptide repeat protein [Melghirimyces profundicolus]PTX53763.1 tetratricopeptide repeat protein [Melghirimyces profundicolus]
MGKFFTFSILWFLTGNPFVALLILFLIIYLLDRRFVGVFPSLTKPFRRNGRIRRLKQGLRLNPHHTSDKRELAHLLMEKKQYREALSYLREVRKAMPDSAEVRADIGLCHLKTGNLREGEQEILAALEADPRVYYGEPYLRLGEALRSKDREKALYYLEKFREIHSSSCEAYYRLGRVYSDLDQPEKSRHAYQEAIEIYRSLPKYKKRSERPWALRSSFRLGLLPSPGRSR